MDSLIAGLDLPAVPLSEQQQKELDKQRALQQQKIKDIKAQLDALRQDLTVHLSNNAICLGNERICLFDFFFI
jgi:uncharacterized membrane-anchored protein YhcB (DUF1043 family)